jgi:hypothetical protein
MSTLPELASRHRLSVGAFATVAAAGTMILLSHSTTLPKDTIAAAGITILRLLLYPVTVQQVERAAGVEPRPGWHAVESIVGGLAIIGFYRVASELFGLTWR